MSARTQWSWQFNRRYLKRFIALLLGLTLFSFNSGVLYPLQAHGSVAEQTECTSNDPNLDLSLAHRYTATGLDLLDPTTRQSEQPTKESIEQAIKYLNAALQIWEKAGESEACKSWQAIVLSTIALAYSTPLLNQNQQTLIYYDRALSIYQRLEKTSRKASAYISRKAFIYAQIGIAQNDLGTRKKALNSLIQALKYFREANDPKDAENIGLALVSLYLAASSEGRVREILESTEGVLPIVMKSGDFETLAKVSNVLSLLYKELGRLEEQVAVLERLLSSKKGKLSKEFEYLELTATMLLGQAYGNSGRIEDSLQTFNKALSLSEKIASRNKYEEFRSSIFLEKSSLLLNTGDFNQVIDSLANALTAAQKAGIERNILGKLFSHYGSFYSQLGENETALNYYFYSANSLRQLGDKSGEATALLSVANILIKMARNSEALKYAKTALDIYQQENDVQGKIRSLSVIGSYFIVLGRIPEAIQTLKESLLLLQKTRFFSDKARVIRKLGDAYILNNKIDEAQKLYLEALDLSKKLQDRQGEAVTLYDLAYLEKKEGDLESSLNHCKRVIEIIQDLRTRVNSPNLRATYLASNYEIYNLCVEVLMQMHQEKPSKQYDVEALNLLEGTRSRSFIELLNEAGRDFSQEAGDSKLVNFFKSEKNLKSMIAAQENSRIQQLSYAQTASEKDEIEMKFGQTINSLTQALDVIQLQIRSKNPAYAAITQPVPLNLQQIQQTVLDPDSVLMQYSLGTDHSYLWVVPKQGKIHSYPLPPKAEIEQAIEAFRKDILETTGNDAAFINERGKALTQKILPAEAMPHLQGKRLIVAADGVLQTLPFAALPDPTAPAPNKYVPLIEAHEIVNIPSATAIATQRQEIDRQQRQGKRNPPKILAAIANPVFQTSSTRTTTESTQTTNAATPSTLEAINLQIQQSAATRSLKNFRQPPQLPSLPNTETIADSILQLVANPSQKTKRVRYAANQDWVMQAPLNQYRYLFFGTHGLADNINPELSFIALSLFNDQGQPIDGYLRLNEIFSLKLSADVVVLNACQTGLGKDMRGEGIIGLTRGFMYAGAKSIVASLWNVSATNETTQLMTDFFAKLLPQDGSSPPTPAAALRSAQLKLRETKPNDPNYWAAFTIQGDWQ